MTQHVIGFGKLNRSLVHHRKLGLKTSDHYDDQKQLSKYVTAAKYISVIKI